MFIDGETAAHLERDEITAVAIGTAVIHGTGVDVIEIVAILEIGIGVIAIQGREGIGGTAQTPEKKERLTLCANGKRTSLTDPKRVQRK